MMTTAEALARVKNYVEKMEALTPASERMAISKQENLEFAKAIMNGLEELDKLRAWREPKDACCKHYEKEGEKPYIKYSCPACGKGVSPVTEDEKAYQNRFCHKCGQALKWGDEK